MQQQEVSANSTNQLDRPGRSVVKHMAARVNRVNNVATVELVLGPTSFRHMAHHARGEDHGSLQVSQSC